MQDFLTQSEENNTLIIKKSINVFSLEKNNILMLLATSSDTNIIEKFFLSYQTKGINFLKNTEETFSLFIHDKNKKTIFVAKDKVGVLPLYYSYKKNNIIASTSIKNFREISSFNAKINTSAIADYLQYGMILQPKTIFENCYKVEAGSYVEFNLKNQKQISRKYWTLENCYLEPKSLFNEEEILNKAHTLLQSSLHHTIQNNANVAFSLSGGYDSSTLVAMAQQSSDKKVNTFSIGFNDSSINEAPHAKKIARHLGTNHEEYYFTAKDAIEIIPKISQIYDEPFADHAAAPTILTAQLLKKNNIGTLIAGDGGDEVFATADDLKAFKRFENTPKIFKQIIASSLFAIPSSKKFQNKKDKLSAMLQANSISEIIKVRKSLFSEKELRTHIKKMEPKILNSFDTINFPKDAETLDQIIGTYFKTTMTDGELVKSHQSMRHENINLAVPFLDTKLIEYLAKVPSSVKVKNDIKKYLLKEIAHQYLPKVLLDRPKSGFDIPFSSWMKNELKEILYVQINEKRLDKDNIFYTSSIIHIRDQFYLGNDAYKYKLWRIFIFQLWYENFQQQTKITKEL